VNPLRPLRHGDRRRAAVALTFDDGPGAVTEAVLDVLRRHGAQATFNLLGERIAGREALVRRVAREGHELGVHGWVHDDPRAHPLAAARGAARTAALTARVANVRPRLYRPPFGLTDRRLRLAMAPTRLRTVVWDVDPRDFEAPGAEAIHARTLAAVRPGSIVLLHDDRPELAPTAEAVDRLLGDLSRRGWRAVTVSELLR
jgi:peptidoglycan-N-acetylglucosamine deacetylase